MVRELTITNVATSKMLSFGSTGKFIIDTIDWDSPSVSSESYRVPFQVGETLAGIIVGTRKPYITGYIIADMSNEETLGMNWNEYYDKQEQYIEDSKEELNKLISVYQEVIIQTNGYYLQARPTQPPKYSNKEVENNSVLCYFTLEFECYKPLFYKNSKLIELASTEDKFIFPLTIPEDTGVIFGEIMRRQSISIENDGDAPAGCVIKITAIGGTVSNPAVYNINTGEHIAFENIELNVGDYLLINTASGEENAKKHIVSTSEEISAIGNIVYGSTFFKIEQGMSYYAYTVSEEQINNVEVSIEFTENYFNIRGM